MAEFLPEDAATPTPATGRRWRIPAIWYVAFVIFLVLVVASGWLGAQAKSSPFPYGNVTRTPVTTVKLDTWHTQGSQIVNSAGQPVRIAGINWYGLETPGYAPAGLWVRNYQDMLDQIKAQGYNTVRLPYSNQLFDPGSKPNGIDYTLNPDLRGLSGLGIMDKVIHYGGSIGLRFILDQHRPDSGGQSDLWYTAAYPESRWLSDWQMLARHYLGDPAVIGADPHNEPAGAACWGCGDPARDWRLAAQRAGDAMLAINPAWLIFVEGVGCVNGDCAWNGENLINAGAFPVALAVPQRLVYEVHDYSATVYAQSWLTAPNFPQNLPAFWDQHWGYLVKQHIAPVLVGEFGTLLDSPQSQQWLRALVAYIGTGTGPATFSWTFWCWNADSVGTGGILEKDWVTIDKIKQGYLTPIMAPIPLPGDTSA